MTLVYLTDKKELVWKLKEKNVQAENIVFEENSSLSKSSIFFSMQFHDKENILIRRTKTSWGKIINNIFQIQLNGKQLLIILSTWFKFFIHHRCSQIILIPFLILFPSQMNGMFLFQRNTFSLFEVWHISISSLQMFIPPFIILKK